MTDSFVGLVVLVDQVSDSLALKLLPTNFQIGYFEPSILSKRAHTHA